MGRFVYACDSNFKVAGTAAELPRLESGASLQLYTELGEDWMTGFALIMEINEAL